MISNSSDSPPAPRAVPRGIAIASIVLALSLLAVIGLQFRWKQDAVQADLRLANLQITALEAALESELVLSSETTSTLKSALHGSKFSTRALLFDKTSVTPERPLAVVIWSDTTQSGQFIPLTETPVATAFSSMSGHIASSEDATQIPLRFVATRSSDMVSLHAADTAEPPDRITVKILPRSAQEPAAHWVGEFRR